MATSFASHYIANLEDTTRYRLDEAARPTIEGKAMATQLVLAIEAARSLGLDVRAIQAELRPLLHYFQEGE